MDKCFNGKELNPITCHFVKKCKPGFTRNKQFLCRKTKKLNNLNVYRKTNKKKNSYNNMTKKNSPPNTQPQVQWKQDLLQKMTSLASNENKNLQKTDSQKLINDFLNVNINQKAKTKKIKSPSEPEMKKNIIASNKQPNSPASYKRVFPILNDNSHVKDKHYIIFNDKGGTGIMLADTLYKNKKMIQLTKKMEKDGFSQPPNGWQAFEKYDGLRGIWTGKELVARPAKKDSKLKGKVFNYVPEWFQKCFPPGVSLDGELWMGRGKFQQISGLSNLKIGKKITKEHLDKLWEDVQFMAFDIPSEKDLPFHQRTVILKETINELKLKHGNTETFPIKYSESVTIKDADHLSKVYNDYIKLGAEGIILREPNSLYETKRSKLLLKMKLNEDDEAKIIGFIKGTGKYEGLLGSIKCELKNGKQFNIGTGLTDEMRKNYSDPFSKHHIPIGGILNFSFMEKTKDGIPRHPVYRGIRTDVVF